MEEAVSRLAGVTFEQMRVTADPIETIVVHPPRPCSINDELATFGDAVNQPSSRVRDMLLFLPRTGMIVVPVEPRRGGDWVCAVVHGVERYPRGGYRVTATRREIETALRVQTRVNGRLGLDVESEDDPAPERYPAAVTVFCDACGVEHTGDYLVRDDDESATRLGYARAHMRTLSWSCDERGDYCPPCTAARLREASGVTA